MGTDVTPIALFQSTLPGWGATDERSGPLVRRAISIHAPRMGSDPCRNNTGHPLTISIHAPRMGSDDKSNQLHTPRCISIHAPRMGSDSNGKHTLIIPFKFQSTLPGWGATTILAVEPAPVQFQSTLPGWGATYPRRRHRRVDPNFNPRSPDGERRHVPTQI